MYSVVVIGGGPGGYAAAIRTAQLGGKVALVEAEQVGGVCVNSGCIPTKVWHNATTLLKAIKKANEFGIIVPSVDLDIKLIAERARRVSNYIRMGMEGLLKSKNVELIKGHAIVKNPQEVIVNGTALKTKSIILATGSELNTSLIKGLENSVWTTNHMINMTEVPSSVLIWGSEAIEVEMACLLNALGSKVVLAFESRRILPDEDSDISQRLSQALREQGVEILSRSILKSIELCRGGYRVILSDPDEKIIEVQKVLAASRSPRSSNMGLRQIGIEIDKKAGICINDKLETNIDGIYAVGDVTGGCMLSHVATSMAVIAAENAMGGSSKFLFHLIPRGIWAMPEIGAVGLSEEAAEKAGIDFEVGHFPYAINGLAMARGEMNGAVKIISNAQSGEIIGVHIIGSRATELIGESVLAMQLKATASDLSNSIRIHPTFSEAGIEAARDTNNWALYLPKR